MTSADGGKGGGGVGNGGVGDVRESPALRCCNSKMRDVSFDEGGNIGVLAVGDEEAGGGGVGDALSGFGEGGIGEGCCYCGKSRGDGII